MFGQTEDSRSLDLFNASRVEAHKPAKRTGYYDFPCTAGIRGLHHHTTEESRSECAPREAREAQERAYRYTDGWLDDAEAGKYGRGDQNSAQYLRRLATVDQRKRAVAEAHTLVNITGGRYSGQVYAAVAELSRNIESGNESKELYGERFARVAREREAELRRVTGNPTAIHNPFRR